MYIISCLVSFLAENIAKQWDFNREQQDTFAAGSQNKCEAAQNNGHFDKEIVPVSVPARKGKCFGPVWVYQNIVYAHRFITNHLVSLYEYECCIS